MRFSKETFPHQILKHSNAKLNFYYQKESKTLYPVVLFYFSSSLLVSGILSQVQSALTGKMPKRQQITSDPENRRRLEGGTKPRPPCAANELAPGARSVGSSQCAFTNSQSSAGFTPHHTHTHQNSGSRHHLFSVPTTPAAPPLLVHRSSLLTTFFLCLPHHPYPSNWAINLSLPERSLCASNPIVRKCR